MANSNKSEDTTVELNTKQTIDEKSKKKVRIVVTPKKSSRAVSKTDVYTLKSRLKDIKYAILQVKHPLFLADSAFS